MGFFKPAWMSNDNDKGLKFVEKETDSSKLAEIAKNAPNVDVRIAAVKKIDDQDDLNYIVRNDQDRWVRDAAVRRITDQSILADYAKNNQDEGVRYEAVARLNMQTVLMEIAEDDETPTLRRIAVERLLENDFEDQSFLGKIGQQDSNEWVRMDAIQELSEKSILEDIVIQDSDVRVRSSALFRLREIGELDQSLFAAVAMQDEDAELRSKAANNIVEVEAAFDLLKKLKYEDVRIQILRSKMLGELLESFVEQLDEQSVLSFIALYSDNIEVRKKAAEKIINEEERAHIEKIIQNCCADKHDWMDEKTCVWEYDGERRYKDTIVKCRYCGVEKVIDSTLIG